MTLTPVELAVLARYARGQNIADIVRTLSTAQEVVSEIIRAVSYNRGRARQLVQEAAANQQHLAIAAPPRPATVRTTSAQPPDRRPLVDVGSPPVPPAPARPAPHRRSP